MTDIHPLTAIFYETVGRSPSEVQAFMVNSFEYDFERVEQLKRLLEQNRDSEIYLRSAPELVNDGKAFCQEAAFFAAWLLDPELNPQLMSMQIPDDIDMRFCVCVYRDPTSAKYGSVAFSRFEHLRDKPAVYGSLEHLAESYRHPPDFEFTQIELERPFENWDPNWGLTRLRFVSTRGS